MSEAPWSVEIQLAGELRLARDARNYAADLALIASRHSLSAIALAGELRCAALERPHRVQGALYWRESKLELKSPGGLEFRALIKPAPVRGLLGATLWSGPLRENGRELGQMSVRFDLRHDLPRVLLSLRRRRPFEEIPPVG